MERKTLRQQLEMIANSDHKEIMTYIAKCYLDITAQITLINRGNHEEIVTYLTANKHSLCPKVKQTLIERGNVDEMKLVND